MLRGDEPSLNRAVTNLVSNALRFAPAHTTIDITVAVTDDGVVELSVTDSGPGLSAEDQPHVFTRFWRGRNAGTGSGLGLSIVKQVVERHSGTVGLRSAPNEGSTFTIRLPRSATGRRSAVDGEPHDLDQPVSSSPTHLGIVTGDGEHGHSSGPSVVAKLVLKNRAQTRRRRHEEASSEFGIRAKRGQGPDNADVRRAAVPTD